MFKDPERVLDQFVLGESRIVADLGAGSGAYTFSAARRVGDSGKVYAIDIQRDLLERLKNSARQSRVHNIDIVWGDIEKTGGTKLKDKSVDAAILSNVFFQVEDRRGVAREAYRILKTGGRALVVDWSESGSVFGPTFKHVFPQEEARRVFEDAQFVYERDINAGAHHYGMVFRK